MGRTVLTVAGILAVAATAIVTAGSAALDGGFLIRLLFVACWLAAAVVVARRGGPGAESTATIVFLISFPVAFSGTSAGLTILDATWRAVGSIALIVFLYLFPRGLFEPRWTAVGCVVSAGYLAARAFYPPLASAPVDLVVFPLTVIVPLVLQVTRYRSASNPTDRRRLKLVGATTAVSVGGQLILFGALSAGWLGSASSAESVVEPISYALALLIPAGVTLALVPLGAKVSPGGRSADPVRRQPR